MAGVEMGMPWKGFWQNYQCNAKVFLLVTFFTSLGVSAFNVLFGIAVLEAGKSEAFLGGVLAVSLLATAGFSLPGGILADMWGKRKTLLLALSLTGAGILGMALLPWGTLTLVFSFLTGMGQALYGVVSMPLLAENSTPAERTHLFSLNFSVFMGAQVVGSLLAGALPGVISVQIALISFALFEGAGFIAAWQMAEETQTRAVSFGQWRKDYLELLRSSLARDIIIYCALIGLGAGLVIPFFNIFLTERLQASTLFVGSVMSLSQVGIALTGLGAPLLVSRYGKVRSSVFAQLASIPFLLMIAIPQSLSIVVLSFLARNILMNLSYPINSSLFMEVTPVKQRATVASIIGFSQNLSRAASAALGGWLMGKIGYTMPYFITAVLYLLATLHLWRAFAKREQKHGGDEVKGV